MYVYYKYDKYVWLHKIYPAQLIDCQVSLTPGKINSASKLKYYK